MERHARDDDPVIFNRQPTLHKMSMMGHRMKVLPWSTFRLNLSCTTPYNADFDGDEMNLHLPQSIIARTEIQELMMVHKNIITPQANRPVMGIVQDALCGVRKMTRRDVFVDRQMLMQLLMWVPSWNGEIPIPAIIKPQQLWTGKQLFSLLIPERINLRGVHSIHDKELGKNRSQHLEGLTPDINAHDTVVIIENGRLISGIICKNCVGNRAGGLIHTIRKEHTDDVTRQFYGNVQTLVNNWLLFDGNSIGVSDTIADNMTHDKIKSELEQARDKVDKIISDAQRGILEATPGNTLRQTFEIKVNKALNDALGATGKAAEKSLSEFNNFKSMVVSGAKGANLNISQIVACVGQQNVEGKRIPFGFRHRTLPHFVKDDYGPESKGFVTNSYLKGLTPDEMFFHAMGGREGLIDTAVKTAETGYTQRRIMKSMEAVSLLYDGTVRNSNGDIIQLLYGEDGMDGAFVEDQTMQLISGSDQMFKSDYQFNRNETESSHLRKFVDEMIVQEITTSHSARNVLDEEFARLSIGRNDLRTLYPTGETKAVFPVNIARLIWDAKNQFRCTTQTKSDLSPLEVIHGVNDLVKKLLVVPGRDAMSIAAQENAIFSFENYVRAMLSSKQVMTAHRFTKQAFNWLLGEIETRFNQAICHPGEMVGALAAKCIDLPNTVFTFGACKLYAFFHSFKKYF